MEGTRFINREQELEQLDTILGTVRNGDGDSGGDADGHTPGAGTCRFVFIAGEPGVGKTRLVREFRARASDTVVYHEYQIDREVGAPFDPFVNMIKDLPASEHTDYALAMLDAGAGGRTSGSVAITKQREQLVTAVADAIIAAATEQPLILHFGSIHYLPRAPLELLRYLAAAATAQHVPLLMIGTYAPEELTTETGADRPLAELLVEMMMEPYFVNIQLDGFDKVHLTALLQTLLHRDDLPPSLVTYVHTATDGNPLYTEEVLVSLMTTGAIDPTDPDWPLHFRADELVVPASLGELIGKRVANLPERERGVLSAAAVLGAAFTRRHLRLLTELDEEQITDALYHLSEQRLVVMLTTDRYRFEHRRIQRFVEAALGPSAAKLHWKAGMMLEAELENGAYQESGELAQQAITYDLARHFYRAEVWPKAVEYGVHAGASALAAHVPESARTHLNRALDALRKIEGTERAIPASLVARAHLLLGRAEHATSAPDAALEHLRVALKNAADMDTAEVATETDPRAQIEADAHRLIGHIHRERSDWDPALEHYREALAATEEFAEPTIEADVYRGMAKIKWRVGEYETALEHLDTAIALADHAHAEALFGSTTIDKANIYGDIGRRRDAIALYEQSLDVLDRAGALSEQARAWNNMGEQYKHLDEFDAALGCYERCIKTAERAGNLRTLGFGLANSAECAAKLGCDEDALDFAERAHAIFDRLKVDYVIAQIHMVYGLIAAHEGEWGIAEEEFDEAVAILEALNIQYDLGVMLYEYGRLYWDHGSDDLAREKWEAASDIFAAIGADEYHARVQAALDKL